MCVCEDLGLISSYFPLQTPGDFYYVVSPEDDGKRAFSVLPAWR